MLNLSCTIHKSMQFLLLQVSPNRRARSQTQAQVSFFLLKYLENTRHWNDIFESSSQLRELPNNRGKKLGALSIFTERSFFRISRGESIKTRKRPCRGYDAFSLELFAALQLLPPHLTQLDIYQESWCTRKTNACLVNGVFEIHDFVLNRGNWETCLRNSSSKFRPFRNLRDEKKKKEKVLRARWLAN